MIPSVDGRLPDISAPALHIDVVPGTRAKESMLVAFPLITGTATHVHAPRAKCRNPHGMDFPNEAAVTQAPPCPSSVNDSRRPAIRGRLLCHLLPVQWMAIGAAVSVPLADVIWVPPTTHTS
jgi:hypothetical protein